MTTTATLAECYCPVCNRSAGVTFLPGPGGRPDASCPHCRSLERQRFLALLLPCLEPGLQARGIVLDVAPAPQVSPLLADVAHGLHLRLDLGADNRLVDVLASLTDLPLADDSVDLAVCYHVLEHIPGDRRAMSELARVLRPGGLGIVQVPWRPGTITDEDPDAPVEERVRRFGQADHVRYYGDDFEQRLVEAGLDVRRITPLEMLGRAACTLFKLMPTETVWLVTPNADQPHPPDVARPSNRLTRTLDDLIDKLGAQQLRLDELSAAYAAQSETLAQHQRARASAERRVALLERRLAPFLTAARRLPRPVRRRIRRVLDR